MEYYGVTGHPLGHTLSPPIHRRLFALEGIQGQYEAYPLPPDQFHARVGKLLELRGFNLTMPYKQAVLPYLDTLHESARRYGSVNTVFRGDDGRHTGYNTDCVGFLKALEGHGIALAGKVCVLGAGGVGRMFAIESVRAGARVTLAVRQSGGERGRQVAKEIWERYGADVSIQELSGLDASFDLIINATPVGMFPETAASPLPKETVAKAGALFDSIYNPRETLLMHFAREAGVKAAGGMDMLVWQAAMAHTYWHKTSFTQAQIAPVIEEMRQLLLEREGNASQEG